jgi:hypothetical protein
MPGKTDESAVRRSPSRCLRNLHDSPTGWQRRKGGWDRRCRRYQEDGGMRLPELLHSGARAVQVRARKDAPEFREDDSHASRVKRESGPVAGLSGDECTGRRCVEACGWILSQPAHQDQPPPTGSRAQHERMASPHSPGSRDHPDGGRGALGSSSLICLSSPARAVFTSLGPWQLGSVGPSRGHRGCSRGSGATRCQALPGRSRHPSPSQAPGSAGCLAASAGGSRPGSRAHLSPGRRTGWPGPHSQGPGSHVAGRGRNASRAPTLAESSNAPVVTSSSPRGPGGVHLSSAGPLL